MQRKFLPDKKSLTYNICDAIIKKICDMQTVEAEKSQITVLRASGLWCEFRRIA